MTTIAWDGSTLAADKRATIAGIRTVITKIRKGPAGNIVAVSGNVALMEHIFAWLLDGDERPEAQGDKADFCGIIEITPQGECWKHERLGRFKIEAPTFACGTGADFAMAAMACDRTAAEAVEIAARFDTLTGDGVDTFTLTDEPRSPRPPRRARRNGTA